MYVCFVVNYYLFLLFFFFFSKIKREWQTYISATKNVVFGQNLLYLGELIEKQSFRSNFLLTQSESQAGNQESVFNQLSDGVYAHWSLKSTGLELKNNKTGYLLNATGPILFSSTAAGEGRRERGKERGSEKEGKRERLHGHFSLTQMVWYFKRRMRENKGNGKLQNLKRKLVSVIRPSGFLI